MNSLNGAAKSIWFFAGHRVFEIPCQSLTRNGQGLAFGGRFVAVSDDVIELIKLELVDKASLMDMR
jgi:hypothetical protein